MDEWFIVQNSHFEEKLPTLCFHRYPLASYLKLNFSPSIFSKRVTTIVHCIYICTYIIVTLYCSRCFYLFPSSPAVFSCSYLASLRSATGEKYSREKLINWKRFVFVEDWLQSLQVAFFPVRVPSARRTRRFLRLPSFKSCFPKITRFYGFNMSASDT